MRLSRFSRCALRFFSFAGMGIARRVGHSSRSAAIYRRRGRESFNAWRLHSEPLEGRAMMAAQSFSGVTLDLDIASDTFVASFPAGAVSTTTDNYTSDTTPAINVIGLNGIPMTAGDVIQIVDATVGMVGAYTVLAADLDFSGAWKSGTLQITTNALSATSATGTVHSLTARHVDNSTLPGTFGTASDPLSVTIDTKGASVTSVTSLNTATAGVGQKLQFLVTFSEPVKVSGSAKLPIIVGSGTAGSPDNNRDASFDSQPSAVTAIFSYTVTDAGAVPDSNDINGVAVNGPISGGSILDRAENVLFSGAVPDAPIQTSAFVVAQGDIVGRFLGVIQGQYMVTSLSTIRAVFDDDNDPTTPSPSQGVTGSGNAVVERSDFTLTRDGEIVPLTGATLTWPIAGSYAFADFQLGNLDSVTNEPGTYRLTFNDLGIAPAFDISWVKSTPTAGELIASLSATPSDPTPATPRSTPVNSVDVKFQDNAGNAVPVTGVDTSKVGSQITQFTLWKNGVQVAWPSGATVTGSGAGYSINGLAAAQVSDGSYQVTLNNDPLIQTLAGTQMITTYSTSWQYVNPKTIQSVAIPSGTYTRGQRIPITVTFNDVVNVPVGSAPTMTLTIGSTQVTTNAPVSGSGSNVLVFGYDVVATDLDVDGITMAPAITGTINDGWGNAVIPTFTVPGNLANVKVDGVAPTVTSVAPPAPGNYNATAGTNNIDITLNLSEASFVSGSPSIPLTIGGAVRQATYVNGGGAVTFQFGADTVTRNAHGLVNGTVVSFSSITTTTGITANTNYYVVNATTNTFQLANTAGGAAIDLTGADGTGTVVPATNTLVFRYTIASTTDVFANGSFTIGQVSLNGATVRDTAGNDANLAFTAPTFSGVNINRSAPAVTITSGSGKTSKVGDVIEFTATFAQAVTVTGSGATGPAIAILIGGTSKNATYTSGTGTTAIKFQYIVQPGDLDTDGIAIPAAAIALGSGTITDSVGTPVLSFAPPTLTTALVDGVAPTVSTATGPAPGNYENVTNNNLDITLTFNEPVNVTGSPSIPLTIGGAVRQATYVSGGSPVTFQDTGDTVTRTNHGFTNGTMVSFSAITSTTGIAINTNYFVVNATANTFQLASTVGGTPLALTTDGAGTVVPAANTLIFRYVIASATDVYANGSFTVGTTVSLNGGTIKDTAGNDYALAVPAVTIAGVNINRTAPAVTITSGSGKTSKVGDVIELTATFAQAVNVTGAPTIAITVGGTSKNATYVSGTGTTAIKFQYIVQLGDLDTDGISIPGAAIVLGTGTITDSVGTPILSFAQPADLTKVLVDGVAPQALAAITGPTPGVYTTGGAGSVGKLTFVVPFDDAVTVTGTPRLTFTLGGSTRQATYASGTGTSQLTFDYTIVAGDAGTSVAVGADPLSLTGGTIRDANGNDADLSKIAAGTFNGVAVNRLAPAASVSIGDNKTSKLGDTIELAATFGQIVNVTGSPTILGTINTATGSKAATFTYVSGSGTTALKFRTTVAANDLDTDGIDVQGAITLPAAAAIKDAAGNDVSLVFTNSPALDTSKVKADGVVPSVVSVTPPAAANYTTGNTLSFTVNFNESVLYTKGTSDATLAVTINGVVRQATYDAASSTATTAVFKYSIVDADASSGSITIGGITLFGSTFRDAAGNDATLTGTTGSASGIIINRTGLTTVTASDSKTYKAGEVIEFTATFSGTVTVTGTPTIAVTVGANPRVAAYASGSGTSTLKFRYTVQTGELDPDGIELPSSTITLPAGSNIVDAASNTAALSFVPPATTGVLVDAVVPAAATIVRGPGLGAAINRVQATQSSGIVFVTGELDATIEVSFSTGSAVVSKSLTGTGLQQAVVLTATDVANVGDGTLTVSVSQLDAVGNRQTVPSAIVTFTLDGTAPAAATIARGPGIGLSINRAQATQTSGVVVVSGELNATITVTFSRTTYTVTKTLTGTGTTQAVVLTDAEATILGDGDVTVSVTQADALGNAQTDPAASVGFKLDATVPGATTLALGSGVANGATEAEATQDSGVVIVNGESGATITVTFTQGTNSITKTLTGDGTAQPVVLTLADIETLGNGLVSVTATQVDAAGNTQSVPASTTAFRLDTIAPSAPRVLLGPGVTNGATLAEATQADGIVRVIGEAGAAISVTFTRGSTTISRTLIGTGAAQAVTLSPGDVTSLGNGVVTVSVNQTDAAGNPQAEPNAVVSVTIDTGAPSAATLALGDGVTGGVSLAEATQTDGVVTVTGESSAAIQVTFRRGTKSVVKNLTGTGAAQAVVLTTDDIRTLGNGTAVVSAIQTDAAGNRQTANASTLQFTLDATAPGVASLALGSGVSNGATQAEATQATGVVTVLGESGATVAVTFTRGRNAVTKTVTGNGATPVAVVLDSADVTALGDGIVTVSTVQADAAGNPQTAAPATLTFTLDTSAPSAPAIAFGIGVATGATAAEATQAGGAVRVTGEPGAAIVVTFTQNAQTVTKTLTGTGSAQPVVLTSGDIAALGDGSITVKAKQTDTAGNVSSESTTSFTLETRLPSSPSLALASDTGSNAADGVTSNTTVNVSGVGTGGSWQYSINGGAFWSPSLPASATSFTLPAGTYPAGRVQVRQTSQAGNLSAASRNSVAYVVDAAPPTVKNITSSAANGTYGVGQPINIQVVFTERVFVTGAPRLELNTIPARYATYSGGSGANILTFTYTPQLGDSSADLSNASSSALLLNDGGSIRDLAGNDASLTLAGPGVRGSLGFGKNIVINAIITASSAGFGNSPATAPQFSAAVERIQLTFNVEVTDVTPRALRLYRDNLAVPLDGATITGSGKSWTLTIPSTATDAKGRYRLDIGGPFAGVAIVSDGVQMDGISSIHWRRV